VPRRVALSLLLAGCFDPVDLDDPRGDTAPANPDVDTDPAEVPGEIQQHLPGDGWTPVPLTVLYAGWQVPLDDLPPGAADCESPTYRLADTPADLDGLDFAKQLTPELAAFDGTWQDALVAWSWRCPNRPDQLSVLGAWRDPSNVLRVSWFAPEGGREEPGRPWLVALMPEDTWTAVVLDFFLYDPANP
jgi:hypothetical protein